MADTALRDGNELWSARYTGGSGGTGTKIRSILPFSVLHTTNEYPIGPIKEVERIAYHCQNRSKTLASALA